MADLDVRIAQIDAEIEEARLREGKPQEQLMVLFVDGDGEYYASNPLEAETEPLTMKRYMEISKLSSSVIVFELEEPGTTSYQYTPPGGTHE